MYYKKQTGNQHKTISSEIVLRDIYKDSGLTTEAYASSRHRYKFEETQEEREQNLKELMGRLTKDFLQTRQGQTWWIGSFYVENGPDIDIRDLTPQDIKLNIRAVPLIGKPIITSIDGRVSAVLNPSSHNMRGTAASCCGGYENPTYGDISVDNWGQQITEKNEEHSPQLFTGGKNKRKLERKMKLWLDLFSQEIYDKLIADFEHEEEARYGWNDSYE